MFLITVILPIIFILFLFYYFLNKNKLYLFYSNNCSHCKNFKPSWEKIKNEKINTEEIDCDINNDKCNKYNIQAYPTILKENIFGFITEYKGDRSISDIIAFNYN